MSCRGFNSTTCSNNVAYGCDVPDCGVAYGRRDFSLPGLTCDDTISSCKWTCGVKTYGEICSNNLDDDGDGLFDCDDPDCQNGFSWSDADAHSGVFSCLGTDQTGDVLGLSNYCADNVDPGVGLCCPTGWKLKYEFGTWSCTGSEACLYSQGGDCDYTYTPANFSLWSADADCLNEGVPLACQWPEQWFSVRL